MCRDRARHDAQERADEARVERRQRAEPARAAGVGVADGLPGAIADEPALAPVATQHVVVAWDAPPRAWPGRARRPRPGVARPLRARHRDRSRTGPPSSRRAAAAARRAGEARPSGARSAPGGSCRAGRTGAFEIGWAASVQVPRTGARRAGHRPPASAPGAPGRSPRLHAGQHEQHAQEPDPVAHGRRREAHPPPTLVVECLAVRRRGVRRVRRDPEPVGVRAEQVPEQRVQRREVVPIGGWFRRPW